MTELWQSLSVDLLAAKKAIKIPDLKTDQLLTLTLLDTASLNETGLSAFEQADLKADYRRLAYLGDYLIDAVLADYLFCEYPDLSHEQMDTLRQDVANRTTLCQFSIQLGWPNYCTSRNRKNRQPAEQEPGTYGEMFEALAAVVYLSYGRDSATLYRWLVNNFFKSHVEKLLALQKRNSEGATLA